MPHIVNTEQAEAWNGYEGTHWAENTTRWESVVGEINGALFAAAAIGERDRVLDVGCGTGHTTRLAARRARHGHATGVDLSAPMLARARATATGEGVRNVRFEQGDAQVHAFPAAGFDVAISRGGIMFFTDPVAAFANIGRALRPGGRITFVCPQAIDRNEWFVVPMTGLLGHPPSVVPGDSGMFSLADPSRIGDVLAEAGFRAVVVNSVDTTMTYGSDAADAAGFFIGSGPVRFHLRGAGQTAVDQARERVTTALRPYEKPGALRLAGAWWLVSATMGGSDSRTAVTTS